MDSTLTSCAAACGSWKLLEGVHNYKFPQKKNIAQLVIFALFFSTFFFGVCISTQWTQTNRYNENFNARS